MIASFPTYDHKEVQEILDTIWAGLVKHLAREGIDDAPRRLVHGGALRELWSDPALFVSQCCGFDLVHAYASKLQPLATPRYVAPGCEDGRYCSLVIVHETSSVSDLEQLRGKVCAINGWESHSGMSALRALIAPLNREGRFFSEVRVTGTHFNSIASVASRAADVAAIDCVTHAILGRYRPHSLDGTRTLCQTSHAPGIPFVTRAGRGLTATGSSECARPASRLSRRRKCVRPAGECSSTASACCRCPSTI